jgi:hypothetical protein
MFVQIAAGSNLYPSIAGPVILLGTAGLVWFGPTRWVPWVGLAVPLVLGVGAVVASTMNGGVIGQLGDPGRIGVFTGSLLHLGSLLAAVVGAIGMLRRVRSSAAT